MSKDFKVYPEGDKEMIERLIYPKFRGLITYSDLHFYVKDIEFIDECKDEETIEQALRDASVFLGDHYSRDPAHVFTISNHKGGVGKTTSTINIGAGLNKLGKKVLLIDLDPQANLSQSLGLADVEPNIYEALRGGNLRPITVLDGLDVVPSTLDLSGAEVELSGEPGREFILKDLIASVKLSYDYILIDSPPSLGLLTVNAFTASDKVFIPVQAQYLALQGLTKLLEVIDKITKRLNKRLEVGGVFITQYDSRKILNRDISTTIEAHFKEQVFKTRIRENIALAEAPAMGVDIFRYQPKSNGAEDYLSLSEEILKIYDYSVN